MQIDALIIELRAKTDQLQASINAIDSQLGKLSASAKRSSDDIAAGFTKGAIQVWAYHKAVQATKVAFDTLIQSGRDMQSLNARMEGLTGSSQGAREALAYLSATAQRQSVDLLQLSDGYIRLLPAVNSGKVSMAEMRRILELTNDNMAAMRISGSEVSLLFFGMSQVLGSANVNMEDLRQVTDRVPGSFDRLASAMGKNSGELRDLITTGRLLSSDIKGPLIEALSANSGAAEKMGDTYEASSARMGNAVREFAAAISENSGLISGLSSLFNAIAESADWAAERINLLSGNLSKVKLSSLIEEMASAKGDLRELNAELADMEGRSGGSPIQQSSRLQGIKELKKQIAEATKEVEDLQKAINDAAGSPATASTSKPNTPVTPIAPEAVAAQREVARLKKQLDELQSKSRNGNAQDEYLKGLQDDAKKAAEDLKRQNERIAEAMNQPFENAARGIQTALSDTFESIFDGSIDSASDAADAIKRVFIRMAAEMATLQIFGPQLSGISGGGGLFSGGAGGGASGMLGNLSNLTSLSGIMNGLNTPVFAAGGTFANGINGVGNFFGLSGPTAAGPTLTGSAGYSAGISSNFTPGAAIASMGGNFLGNAVFGGGKYSGVGGTAGGIIGTAVGGPIGGFVGSFLGNGLGGMIGGSRPHPASTFGTRGLDFNRATLLSKHMDTSTASGMAGSLQQALATLSGAGLNTSFIQGLQGGVDDGTGFYSFGDWSQRNPRDTVTFDPNNADNGLARFLKLVLDASGDLSGVMDAELIPALRNLSTEGKTSAEVLQEITNALTRDDQRKAFMQQLNASLLESALPGYNAIAQATAEYEANMARAKELGVGQAGIARLTALHQTNVQRLLEQNDKTYQDSLQKASELSRRFGQVGERFKDILWSVTNGQYSPLTPSANLDSIRGMVQSAGARARLGDVAAQEELANLLPQFLQLSGSVNGFNSDFEKDRALTQELASAAQTVAERQANLMDGILKQSEKQTSLLERMLGGRSVVTGANAVPLLQQAIASGAIDGATANGILRASGYTGALTTAAATQFFNSDLSANAKALQAGAALGLPQFTVPSGTAANDNSASIAALRSDMQALIRVTAASGQLNADGLAQLNSLTQRMARNEELRWA